MSRTIYQNTAMKLKIIFTVAALGGAVIAQAQSGGAGGSGSGSGGASGSGSGASGTGTSGTAGANSSGSKSVGSAGGSNVGTISTSGAPNTSSSMPSRSAIIDAAQNPGEANAPTGRTPLPPGLTTAPVQPGVSPLTGLNTAEIPSVSPGTAPIGANGERSTSRSSTALSSAPDDGGVNNSAQVAAPPQTNPRVGLNPGPTTVVPTPPPANPTATPEQTPSPDSNNVWVAGHYSWMSGQWTWVDASWQRPPHVGAAWVPGSYDAQNLRWTEGHWDTSGVNARTSTRDRERAKERGEATPRK